jgi:hypothetical protein
MYLAGFSRVQIFIVEQIFQDQNEVGFACIVNLQVSVAYPYEAQLWVVSLCVNVAGCRQTFVSVPRVMYVLYS